MGGTHNTSISTGAYRALKMLLGEDTPTEELSATYEWAKLEEVVLAQLPIDTRSIFPHLLQDQKRQLDEYAFIDEWGITWRRPPEHPQYHMVGHPLAEATIDDMGVQNGLMIKPELYRTMIKPLHRRYIEVIKAHTDAKIIMHACGSVVDIMDDYIDIGVDALNPVQVLAAHMAPRNLYQQFGGRIAFWGGIDTQKLLPKGNPDDIRLAVRDIIRETHGMDGGTILASVHNVQSDTPPRNVLAMLNEGETYSPL